MRAFFACVLIAVAGWYVRYPLFKLKEAWLLPKYDAMVDRIKAGELRPRDQHDGVSVFSTEAPMVQSLMEERTPKQTLIVEVITDHFGVFFTSGYLYTESGRLEPDSKLAMRWHGSRKINDHWYYVVN